MDNSPEQFSVDLYKHWIDYGNKGSRQKTYIKLSNNKSITTRSFEVDPQSDTYEKLDIKLPKYRNGELVTYTFTEDTSRTPAYTTQHQVSGKTTGDKNDGDAVSLSANDADDNGKAAVHFYNNLITVDISGTMNWEDGNNVGNTHPATVTVELLANGADAGSKTVGASDSWKYTFDKQPKYTAQGTEIVYTIKEPTTSEKYSGALSGYDITSTLTLSVDLLKIWNDDYDYFNKQASTVLNVYRKVGGVQDALPCQIIQVRPANRTQDFDYDDGRVGVQLPPLALPVFDGDDAITYVFEEVEPNAYSAGQVVEDSNKNTISAGGRIIELPASVVYNAGEYTYTNKVYLTITNNLNY